MKRKILCGFIRMCIQTDSLELFIGINIVVTHIVNALVLFQRDFNYFCDIFVAELDYMML